MGAFHKADNIVAAHGAVAVTLSDSTVIPTTRSLYVGTGGDLQVTMTDGQIVIFKNVLTGILPVQVTSVWSTNSTASDILALY